ncbi:predicted protein [Nematostella vectensis]|uniref:DNA helicase n=1 Tax=Nematostella vectensis TaxID=45351 RepID=A7SZW9_NEMVE|nr:predicted protein [Nematostella vectensis]|eukprot:XP_001622850.1 hypothetical protein NEMVEDRAFT_v1g220157 [Nematostella vectensis]
MTKAGKLRAFSEMTRLFVRGSSWEDPPTEKEVEEHFTGFHSFSREQDLIWGMGGGGCHLKIQAYQDKKALRWRRPKHQKTETSSFNCASKRVLDEHPIDPWKDPIMLLKKREVSRAKKRLSSIRAYGYWDPSLQQSFQKRKDRAGSIVEKEKEQEDIDELIAEFSKDDLPAKDTSIGNSIMMRTSRLFSPNARGEIPGAFRIGGCRSGHWITLDTDEFDTLMYRDEEEGKDLFVEATFVLLCKGPTQKDLRAGTDPEVDPVQVVMSKTSIGSGASSRVFKGTYPLPSGTLTHLACKEFIVPISLKHKVRLKRELQFLKQLKHPNILHHFGYDFTRSILVTELLEKEIVIANEKIQIHNARDLLDVAEEICLPWKDRAFVIKEAAKGLSYLHNKGIVHSDIKTCNILVGESSSEAYKVKLGDFGAAHYEFRQFSTSTTSCSMEAQTVIGTAAYTAPELLERGAMPDMAKFLAGTEEKDGIQRQLLRIEERISLIVIDECHLIFERSGEFRKCFEKLSGLQHLFPDIPIMALTATLSERHRKDLVNNFLRKPVVLSSSINRPNIYLGAKEYMLSKVSKGKQGASKEAASNKDASDEEACEDEEDMLDSMMTAFEQSIKADEKPQIEEEAQEILWRGYATKLGITNIRPFQIEAIRAFSNGKDCLVVQPTSAGKSACFQIPSLMPGGKFVLVVCPTISLIVGQVTKMRALGINAVNIGPGQKGKEGLSLICAKEWNKDHPVLVYTTPEFLAGTEEKDGIQRQLLRIEERISLIVIDECHLIFERSGEFRKCFEKLSGLQHLFPDIPIMALTATLSERHRKDLVNNFLRRPVVLSSSINRPNIYLGAKEYMLSKVSKEKQGASKEAASNKDASDEEACEVKSKWENVVDEIIDEADGEYAIVFMDFVSSVKDANACMQRRGATSLKYHGKGLTENEKIEVMKKIPIKRRSVPHRHRGIPGPPDNLRPPKKKSKGRRINYVGRRVNVETTDTNGNWEGWFLGTVASFNSTTKEYQITFDDFDNSHDVTVPENEIPAEDIELLD